MNAALTKPARIDSTASQHGDSLSPVAETEAAGRVVAADMESSPASLYGDDEDEPLFSEIMAALPDRRYRLALLRMISAVGWSREIEEDDAKRVGARNRAIRAVAQKFYGGLKKTNAARKFATDLALYARVSYPQTGPCASAHRRALRAVLNLNEGSPLGYRRILDLM